MKFLNQCFYGIYNFTINNIKNIIIFIIFKIIYFYIQNEYI